MEFPEIVYPSSNWGGDLWCFHGWGSHTEEVNKLG